MSANWIKALVAATILKFVISINHCNYLYFENEGALTIGGITIGFNTHELMIVPLLFPVNQCLGPFMFKCEDDKIYQSSTLSTNNIQQCYDNDIDTENVTWYELNTTNIPYQCGKKDCVAKNLVDNDKLFATVPGLCERYLLRYVKTECNGNDGYIQTNYSDIDCTQSSGNSSRFKTDNNNRVYCYDGSGCNKVSSFYAFVVVLLLFAI